MGQGLHDRIFEMRKGEVSFVPGNGLVCSREPLGIPFYSLSITSASRHLASLHDFELFITYHHFTSLK